ncbi:BMP family lipoprotein [Clostridium uliginosum]|uniref:Basic membrane protein A n=1 Tax=Clostridium uliginosum TaxID=119641 RepID=A0A1I1NSX1_9CLOT|nr:BMP family ABC transporter substrate-binding protein [Clostridium uliginosum]SFD00657.1 basic membrane protein A [Clostridium uliginosum]
MKKRLLSIVTLSVLAVSMFVGCGSSKGGSAAKTEKIKVGMVTDSGTIDDKSFNQGTWEGIKRTEGDLGTEIKYLKPNGNTEAEYTKEIGNLYDAGFKFIVTPGFKFETAIYKSQDKYKDANFVLIDGVPNDGSGNKKVGENAVSIMFAEEQAGFLAGVSASVQLKEGELGFVGGMEIPAPQRFNWGFQQGVAYSNANLGTKMELKQENVLYQGSFDNSAAGQQIAAQMYDRGVKAIFCAAGGVGNGVISEAKTRAGAGKEAWVVGVDSDQYNDGIYKDDKSVILTSAMKKVDQASYDMVKSLKDGKFPGGKELKFDATNDGIGIPEKNPNLNENTIKTVKDVFAKIKDGSIKVSDKQGDLFK